MSTLAYPGPENWSAFADVAQYVSMRLSVLRGSNPCLATLTYLCLSIFSTLPRFLSTTNPRTMYVWSYSNANTARG